MGINNPIPRSLRSESKKAAKVLSAFIKPNQVAGPDQVIPPRILKNAKGLAVITVLKAGFLFSGRAGSGVIVARLPDGGWSAPSAIITAGAGMGGMIGAELTDFVFVLNTKAAVDTFAQMGSVTLGTNVSVAAGPLGRSAEAAGTATIGSVSAVFAYSKTKGLYAGISLEGSAIIERREANRKFYGQQCKARNILAGQVDAPPACDSLMRVLNSRVFNNRYEEDYDYYDDDYYDDIPDDFSDSTSQYSGRRGSAAGGGGAFGSGGRRGTHGNRRRRHSDDYSDDDYYSDEDDYDDGYNRRRRNEREREKEREKERDRDRRIGGSSRSGNTTSSTSAGFSAARSQTQSSWEDDIYDSGYNGNGGTKTRSRGNSDVDRLNARLGNTRLSPQKNGSYNNGPSRPLNSTKPNFGNSQKSNSNQAIALYTFKGEQSGDLPFKKGDVINIMKRTETVDDWWTGSNNGQTGIFPANYVELV